MDVNSGDKSGKLVSEMVHVTKTFTDTTGSSTTRTIVRDFTATILRGDKIGLIGANGTGKTSFLKLLTGGIEPDKGKIVIGETVVFGYYSQDLIEVDPDMKVIDVVREVAEFIPLEKGRQLSAAQLLERFLFPRDMHYHFVHKLSGGEKRRLKLLRVLMLNPNFLILDEPTNDLDIFAMSVLEDYLRQFQGSLIVVSHDRYFMDKMVDHLFVFQGKGKIKDLVGNYHVYRNSLQEAQRQQKQEAKPTEAAPSAPVTEKQRKMSFKEKQEFEHIEKTLPQLETEKEQLSQELSSGALSNDELQQKGERLGQIVDQIDELTMRWLELSEFA
mgnify:CR=1 FL=1